jgi:hypothetical protein
LDINLHLKNLFVPQATGWMVRGSYAVWGKRSFSVNVQTSCGANPASYSIITGLLSGVKRLGREVKHSPLLFLRFGMSGAIPLFPYMLHGTDGENFTFLGHTEV